MGTSNNTNLSEAPDLGLVIDPHIVLKFSGVQFVRCFDLFINKRCVSDKTASTYLYASKIFFDYYELQLGKLHLKHICSADIENFEAFVKRHNSKKYNLLSSLLPALFNMFVAFGLISESPIKEVVKLRKNKTFKYEVEDRFDETLLAVSREEIRTLITSIDLKGSIDFRDKALISVLFYGKAKLRDVLTATISSFCKDKSGNYWLIFPGKIYRSERAPINQETAQLIIHYLSFFPDHVSSNTPLFQTLGRSRIFSGKKLHTNSVSLMIKYRVQIAGLSQEISAKTINKTALFSTRKEFAVEVNKICYS